MAWLEVPRHHAFGRYVECILTKHLADAENALGALGRLRLHTLRSAEEGGEALVAGHLGRTAVAILGTVQGVAGDAYKVVVLVPVVRSL